MGFCISLFLLFSSGEFDTTDIITSYQNSIGVKISSLIENISNLLVKLLHHNLLPLFQHTKYLKRALLSKLNHNHNHSLLKNLNYNEIDLVLFFRDPLGASGNEPDVSEMCKLCDIHNIPIATNVATAEVLIMGVDRGDLAWREIVNPKANSGVIK